MMFRLFVSGFFAAIFVSFQFSVYPNSAWIYALSGVSFAIIFGFLLVQVPVIQAFFRAVYALPILQKSFAQAHNTFSTNSLRFFKFLFTAVSMILAGFIIGASYVSWHTFFQPNLTSESYLQTGIAKVQLIHLPTFKPSAFGKHAQVLHLSAELKEFIPLDGNFDAAFRQHFELRDTENFLAPVSSFALDERMKEIDVNEGPSFSTGFLASLVSSFSSRPSPKVQLSWYLNSVDSPAKFGLQNWPQPGEVFWVSVRLKPPIGQHNLAGFDYESYLFSQGIEAKGYIKTLNVDERDRLNNAMKSLTYDWKLKEGPFVYGNDSVRAQPDWWFAVQNTRGYLLERLDELWGSSEFKGIYQALVVGEKSNISPEQWDVFRQTGTIHLMAISGLHIGLVAGFGFAFFWLLWKVVLYPWQRIDLLMFCYIGALIFATLYALLSGFSVATQRAWIMVVVGVLFFLKMRSFQPWSAWFMALFCVLLWDPRSVLSLGFWLSFIAVAWVFLWLPVLRHKSYLVSLVIVQIVFGVALIPWLVVFYSQIPLFSFWANIVVLPIISFLILPGLLLLVVLSFVFPKTWVLVLSAWLDKGFSWLWDYLYWIHSFSEFVDVPTQSMVWAMVVSVALMLITWRAVRLWQGNGEPLSLERVLGRSIHNSPKKQRQWQRYQTRLALIQSNENSQLPNLYKMKARLWGLVLLVFVLLAVFLTRIPVAPSSGQVRLTLFDVGQGQAIALETQSHRLLYDLGPYWGKTMDGSELAVLPYLRYQGVSKIDRLIISHSDLDHAGGLDSLLQKSEVESAISGQADVMNEWLQHNTLSKLQFEQCVAGQQWQWDGVEFEIMAPLPHWELSKLSDNDTSCVLKVSTGRQTLWITGDLSEVYEDKLVRANLMVPEEGVQTILVAGHHGSRYSTGEKWLDALAPNLVLFSTQAGNRFHFPNQAVLDRLEQRGIEYLNTACSGSVSVFITPSSWQITNQQRIDHAKWYYQRCFNNQDR